MSFVSYYVPVAKGLFFFFQDLHATGSQCATSFLKVIENYVKKPTKKPQKKIKYIIR